MKMKPEFTREQYAEIYKEMRIRPSGNIEISRLITTLLRARKELAEVMAERDSLWLHLVNGGGA